MYPRCIKCTCTHSEANEHKHLYALVNTPLTPPYLLAATVPLYPYPSGFMRPVSAECLPHSLQGTLTHNTLVLPLASRTRRHKFCCFDGSVVRHTYFRAPKSGS